MAITNNGPNLEPPTNPLFVEVVLKNIFNFLKGNNNAKLLGSYRFVCKYWDQLISRLIRHEATINLENLLLRYPKGMGWTELKIENSFKYGVPYPPIHPFENINVTENCWALFPLKSTKITKLEKWFEVMGSQVKTLYFNFSPFERKAIRCCKTLENVLKIWCPNLKKLCIYGYFQAEHIIFTSYFTNTSKSFICTKLEEFEVEGTMFANYTREGPRELPTNFTPILNEFIYNHGLPSNRVDFPRLYYRSGKRVNIPEEPFNNSVFPDVSQFIPENFFPKELDGGIVGQLMSCTSIKKLKLMSVDPFNFNEVVALFHYRQNNWRSTLKHLELRVCSMENVSQDLVVFGKLNFPLRSIILKENFDHEDANSKMENMTRFLANFSETLEYLQYRAGSCRPNLKTTKFMLPVLPKLKILKYGSHFDCSLCPINIMTNLPSLEKFYLKGYPSHVNDTLKYASAFMGQTTGNLRNEMLKEVNISAALSGRSASNLLNWFPRCKKMTINILDKHDGGATFLNKLATSDVKNLEITLTIKKKTCEDDALNNTNCITNFSQLTNLETLDMRFGVSKKPFCVLKQAFSEGLGAMDQLKVLRLSNFMIFKKEEADIQKSVSRIPVVTFLHVSYVK